MARAMSPEDAMSDSVEQHRKTGESLGALRCAIVTVSDTRTPETDKNGKYLREELEAAGHEVALYAVVPDDPLVVQRKLDEAIGAEARILLFNGGTGIARRDQTIDALERRFEKSLPGFGELFRMLSWEQIGSAAMMSRAAAGTIGSAAVFAMPGSHKAVQLAWETLIEPEIGHLAEQLTK